MCPIVVLMKLEKVGFFKAVISELVESFIREGIRKSEIIPTAISAGSLGNTTIARNKLMIVYAIPSKKP